MENIEPLIVTGFHARNIMAIEEFSLVPGKVTLIEAPNAKGKTSLISGFESLFRAELRQ